jgi:hypothetical protein
MNMEAAGSSKFEDLNPDGLTEADTGWNVNVLKFVS